MTSVRNGWGCIRASQRNVPIQELICLVEVVNTIKRANA